MTPPTPRWWQLVLPALLTVLVGMFQLSYRDGETFSVPNGWEVILTLNSSAALLLRHRLPLAITAFTVFLGAVLPFVPPHPVIVDTPSIVALFTLATCASRRTAWTTAAVAVVVLTTGSALWLPGHLWEIRTVLPLNYLAIAVAAGDALRNQRALVEQERERAREAERTRDEEARRRVRDERIRIARDLHDVVAHHITLVNAQAGVAHHLLGSHPVKARQALADIRETSRAALEELRATVGLLRQENETAQSRHPVPRFGQVAALVDSFRAAGFEARLSRTGTPRPLTAAADLAAYRIVQEALTNAGKHCTTRRMDVHIAYSDDALHLTITNPADPAHRGPGTGHGVIGMHERAQSVGGSCTARTRPDGTFEVSSSLPLHRGGTPA